MPACPRLTCAAGDGGCEAREASRLPVHPATSEGKAGRVNNREPSMMPREKKPPVVGCRTGVQGGSRQGGVRRQGRICRPCGYRSPRVERAPSPAAAHARGAWQPRWGPAGSGDWSAKIFVQRDRPAETLPDVILRGQSAAHGLSFPSGHAMVIFAIAALVVSYFKSWWRVLGSPREIWRPLFAEYSYATRVVC